MKKYIIILLFTICLILLFIPTYSYTETEINIWNLKWKIFIPKENFKNNCFIYVHWDWDMNIDAFWFYRPYFEEFAKGWWCSISWNKWIDWKNQSMLDRAIEVDTVVNLLKDQYNVNNIIVIWWSQSGWVMPYISQENIDAIIQISWAVDWISQWQYMTKVRATIDKLSKNKLQEKIKSDKNFNDHLLSWKSYGEYEKIHWANQVWDNNWNFWQKNISEDIRKTYGSIKVPYLAIFWWNDAHVDVAFSQKTYKEVFAQNNILYRELFYPKWNHTLIKSSKKAFVWEWIELYKNIIKNEILGIDAYPKNHFKKILQFTDNL
jgi:hypothetical protein